MGVVTTEASGAADPESYTIVTQYGCGLPGNIMVTGPETIRAGRYGNAYFDQFLYVSIDEDAGDPAPGEEWGPSDGSWVLTHSVYTRGFFAQGHSANGGTPKRSMFLRNFVRAAASNCSSSSSSAQSSLSYTSSSQTSSGQSSGSGSSSSSSSTSSSPSSSASSGTSSGMSSSGSSCPCVTVVTSVSCSGGSLTYTTTQARGCC